MKNVEYIQDEREKGSSGVFKDKDGDIFYLLNGKIHRSNGPSCIWHDGVKWWYYYGEEAKSKKEFYDPIWRKKVEIKVLL